MNKTTDHTLDHATARIVTELAAKLLPPLQDSVAGELAKTVEVLPGKSAFEESLASLKQLQEIAEGVAASLDAARETLKETTERLDGSFEQMLSLLQANPGEDAQEATKLLRSLEASLLAWEGILKADGRAQTRELNEFSSEMSELVRDMSSNLPQMLKEVTEKNHALQAGTWTRSLQLFEARIASLERRVTFTGFVFAVILVAIAIILAL